MDTVPGLLEAKRSELGENKCDFAKRLGLGKAMYEQVIKGIRPFPKRRLESAGQLLGKSVKQLRTLSLKALRLEQTTEEIYISAEEFETLAKIANAAGYSMPLSLALSHLRVMRTLATR